MASTLQKAYAPTEDRLVDRAIERVDRTLVERSSAVDRWLELMNEAIDDSPWCRKQDALATYMGIDKAYLSRLRSGEKPWRVEHVCNLPDDIEAKFEALRAESFGLIVVTPLQGSDAVKGLVGGLVGLLAKGIA